MTDKSSESVLFDDEKMAIISHVVGTIAHDFNNLLMPLLAYPELIRNDLPEGTSGRELLDVIEKTSRDMVHITEQLLNFTAKTNGVTKGLINVNDAVSKALSLLTSKGAVPSGVSVRTVLASDISPVRGSLDHLAMAVYNICMNGVEASGNDGSVEIRTENTRVTKGTSAVGMPHGEGQYVKISVVDGGPGIPDVIKNQIFNPFFTTKKSKDRRGAGLGLSVSYRIVKSHGGYIDFSSETGQRTTFDIYLPVEDGNQEDHSKADKSGEAISGDIMASSANDLVKCDDGRVLVVDDERTILRLFQMILSSGIQGRTIDVASNGELAVKAFSEHHHAVIIMDLHMPVMDGQAAFFKLEELCKENNWQMPSVVFCTGFAPPDSISDVVDKSSKHCLLSKPVGGDTLVEAVKSRLRK